MSQEKQINQSALLAGVVGQVGCMTIILIGLAFGAGWLLDRYLETKPVFTVLFLVGSVPVTLFITVRVTLAAAARAQQTDQTQKP